ncbi:MAG: hypothetical protein ACWGOX_13115 [Desulforhopalus sp.]
MTMMLFDAHTHIYGCFDLDVLFDAACENFLLATKAFGKVAETACFLMLTETGGLDYFSRLQEMAGSTGKGGRVWSVRRTEEKHSLWVDHDRYPGMRLAVVAGRQLVTGEGLELLALLTETDLEDGMALERAARSITDRGGIAVCPWGAGKWLGKRGRFLGELQQQTGGKHFFLGDSGVRPSFWGRPQLLKRAAMDAKILSGSDPLPLPGEERRVGSFGGCLEGRCSGATPAGSLREGLLDPAVKVTGYGRQLPAMTFFRGQIGLRLHRSSFLSSIFST